MHGGHHWAVGWAVDSAADSGTGTAVVDLRHFTPTRPRGTGLFESWVL